ncbi:MAG: hypothetical protein IJT12_09670 [Paludibacteraceae bacterium]|nr:hypothetical protein [Paludibacteraceae bacterium]
MRHIELSQIASALEQREQYGASGVDIAEAVDILLSGWCKCESRRRGCKVTAAKILERGWMSYNDAVTFCDYCIADWRPAFL